MKTKAIVKGNILYLKRSVKFKRTEIEVDISDEDVQIEEKGQSFSEAIWDTIGRFPEVNVDWKNEWHKHLEEKYHG